MKITINMPKAKAIAHDRRRVMRAAELAPFDEIIAKQVPGTNVAAAEAERQKVRSRYDKIQTDIDKAKTPAELKAALGIV